VAVGESHPLSSGPIGVPRSKGSSLPGRGKGAEKDLVGLVDRLILSSKNLRRKEEASWYVDAKYLAGEQWVTSDPRHLALTTRAKKPWRIRQTINHLRPNTEVLLNILTSSRPSMQVVPTGPEPERRQAARAAGKMLSYIWVESDMDELLEEAALWMLVTGRAFLRVSWDPHAGDMMSVPDYDSLPPGVLPGPDAQPEFEEIPIGEVSTDVIPPFNMHVDPASTSIRKARWCGHEQYMHVEEAKMRWPEAAKKISADSGQGVWHNYQRRLLFERGGQATSEDVANTVTIKTMYFRPDGKYRHGRKLVVSGKHVLEDVDSPFDGSFPYVDFCCYPNPGSYWAQGAVNLGRNAQTSFNRYRSLYMEMLTKTGIPQWLVTRGAGVTRQNLTDEAGLVIFQNPTGMGDAVKQIPGMQPPPGWNQLMSMDLQDMRDQMGVVDVMRGVNPPGVRSGRSIAYLTEQNLGRHGPVVRRFERSIKALARLWLKTSQKFVAEDRMLQIVGEDGSVEVFRLKQSDLSSAKDVVIHVGSGLPESKVARQDFIMDLWAGGLITDEAGMPNPKKALRLLEYSMEKDVYESNDSDLQWAMEENEILAMGGQIMPELHDNHTQHADVMVAFMRTARFRRLPEESKNGFRAHLDRHIEILQGAKTMGADAGPDGGQGPGGAGPEQGGPPGEPRTDLRGGPV
jgi:hypothetical protein